MSEPRWGGLLLLTTLVTAGLGVAFLESEVGRQALVDQWERTAAAFGRPVDDAGYARLEQLSDREGPAYALVTAVLGGPVLAAAVAGLVLLIWRGGITFRQAMAVSTHAGVILAIRQLVIVPIGYLRESTSSATSLGSWFSMLDEASPAARVLGALDVFVIWWAIVLAIGVSVLCQRRARTVAAMFVGLYAALAVLLALAMAVTAGSSA